VTLAALINARFGTADLMPEVTAAQRTAMYQYAIKQITGEEHHELFKDIRICDRPIVARAAMRLALVPSRDLAELLAEENGPVGRLDNRITRILVRPQQC
jgi:hypothetical protein